MSESRDSNDPRDAMRQMRKETEAELDRAEAEQTGGQEHASQAERDGVRGSRKGIEVDARPITRATQAQSDADRLRVPRGDPVGGGGTAGGLPPAGEGEKPGRS